LFALGIALLVAHASTKLPHTDEGDLASAAASLLDRGRVAFPMAYQYGPTVRDAYYLAPPFYPAALAAWFAAFGRSLVAYRLFHVGWVVLLLLAWIRIVGLAAPTRAALAVAAVLFAFNYDLLNLGVSRYDIVCAALNAAAIASYAAWRERHFGRAVLVANVFLALAATTHPYAVFGLVGCLAIVVATGDWRRIRPVHALLALAPHVLAFGAWALMIGGHWSVLRQQIAMQAGSRGIDYGNPVRVYATDLAVRWWQLFAGWRGDVPAVMRAKTLFLLLWAVVPFLAIAWSPAERRPLRWGIVAYTVAILVLLPLTDNMHVQIYNIHAIAGFTALTAIVVADAWARWPRLHPLLGAAVAGMAVFGLAGIGLRARQNDLGREYAPAHAALLRGVSDGDVVVAPSELGFGLGFEAHLRDDPGLGSIGAGPMPAYIVTSKERNEPLPKKATCVKGVAVHDTTRYAELPIRTPRESYRVYRRVDDARGAAAGGPVVLVPRSCDGAIR
jgi:hypothetical protein